MSTLAAEVRLILRNDLRLLLRALWKRKLSTLMLGLLIGGGLVLAHAVAILVFSTLPDSPSLTTQTSGWAFVAFLLLGASMAHAISLLFERSDFDLLLSSPVSPRAVLLARMLTIGLGACTGSAFFLVPILNALIVTRSPTYFFGYVTWLLLSLFCASTGTALTLTLVRALGARKARIWVQAVGAVLGASIYIGFQLGRYFADHAIFQALRGAVSSGPLVAVARSAQGNLTDLALLVSLAALAVALTSRLLARTFLGGLQESTERRSKRRRRRTYRIRNGVLRATFWKEVRLIARDPLLLSQILPSIMYLLPALLGVRAFGGWGILAPLSVILAGQFSLLLTSVAVGGEEGLDLIRSSPLPEIRLRIAKVAAATALPVLAAAVLCLVLAALGHPWLALVSLLTGMATAAGCSWLKAADVVPAPRADILRSGGRRFSLRSLVSGMIMISAAAGVGVLAGNGPVLLALLILGATALGILACFVFVSPQELAADTRPA